MTLATLILLTSDAAINLTTLSLLAQGSRKRMNHPGTGLMLGTSSVLLGTAPRAFYLSRTPQWSGQAVAIWDPSASKRMPREKIIAFTKLRLP